jgi:hypothetical protein
MKQNFEDCDANEQSIAQPMLYSMAKIRSNQPFRQNVRLLYNQWERAGPICENSNTGKLSRPDMSREVQVQR